MTLTHQSSKSKTYLYLFPALKVSYENLYRDFLHGITRKGGIVNVFLDDMDSDVTRENYTLYVLFNPKKLNDVEKAFSFLRTHISYVSDYPSGENHMFILKLSESKYKAYDAFLASAYSKMYSKEELKTLYAYFDDPHPYKVIIKDEKVANNLLAALGYNNIEDLASEYDSIIDEREFFSNTETSYHS